MTPAQNFAQFLDLKELTQATDEQVIEMLVYGCKQGPVANFEDIMTERLLRLLRHMTGIPWVRGWEQGARPDSQYGTVWLYGSKGIGQPQIEYNRVIDGSTNLELPDLCEVVYQTFEFQFQLDSYRDSGEPDRNQDITATTSPRMSAADVIHRVITAFGHPRFRAALAEGCMVLGSPPFGNVRNYAKPMIQNTFEGRAGVDFFVRAQTLSSLRSPTFGDVDWGFLCPTDAQLNPDPPAPPTC